MQPQVSSVCRGFGRRLSRKGTNKLRPVNFSTSITDLCIGIHYILLEFKQLIGTAYNFVPPRTQQLFTASFHSLTRPWPASKYSMDFIRGSFRGCRLISDTVSHAQRQLGNLKRFLSWEILTFHMLMVVNIHAILAWCKFVKSYLIQKNKYILSFCL